MNKHNQFAKVQDTNQIGQFARWLKSNIDTPVCVENSGDMVRLLVQLIDKVTEMAEDVQCDLSGIPKSISVRKTNAEVIKQLKVMNKAINLLNDLLSASYGDDKPDPLHTDPAHALQYMYTKKLMNIAISPIQFNYDDYDGFLYYNQLYIRKETLEQVVQKYYEGDRLYKWTHIIKNLTQYGIINQWHDCTGRVYNTRAFKMRFRPDLDGRWVVIYEIRLISLS